MNSVLNPIAQFMCMAYDSEGPHSIPELRWKLWSKKNKEAENLPPTVATFIPLIQRTNLVGRVLKAYNDPNPVLPPITECGWIRDPETNTTAPVHCLLPPAPDDVLEFVNVAVLLLVAKTFAHALKAESLVHLYVNAMMTNA